MFNAKMVKDTFSTISDERKVVISLNGFEYEVEMIGYGARQDENGHPYSYVAIVARTEEDDGRLIQR